MNLCYMTLIKKNKTRVLRIRVPDLGIELKGAELLGLSKMGLRKFVAWHVEVRVKQMQMSRVELPEPTKLKDLHETLATHDFYMPVDVEIRQHRRFFAKLLPFLGGFSTVVSAVSGTVISTIALQLAMQKVPDKNASLALSISQSVVSNSLGMIIYFYSNSRAGLANLGGKIDTLIDRRSVVPEEKSRQISPRSCSVSSRLIIMKALLGTAVVINTASIAISGSQQLGALGIQAHNAGSLIPDELFDFSKWVLIITAGISNLSFVSAFVAQFYADFEKRVVSQPAGVDLEALEEGRRKEMKEPVADEKMMSGENRDSEMVVRMTP